MYTALALSLVNHDSAFAYFDGSRVHYTKLERPEKVKRYRTVDFLEVRQLVNKYFDIDLDSVDELVLDFEGAFIDCNDIHSLIRTSVDLQQCRINETLYFELDQEFKDKFNIKTKKVWYVYHHYGHSLSGWMLHDRDPDVSIIIDGEGLCRSWAVFKNDEIIDSCDVAFGSIGIEMMNAGLKLGVTASQPVDIAGKVMGLQSYGTVDYGFVNYLKKYNMKKIKQIFDYKEWIRYKNDQLVAKLSPLDWIASVHARVGELLVEFFKQYASKDDIIFYSGGVAQNVIWNTQLKKNFPNLIIPPHSADDGICLGTINWLMRKNGITAQLSHLESFPYAQRDIAPITGADINTIKLAAKLLANGKTVGWYQGCGELGPRALGNRSILMDPRIPNGKSIINAIKQRENYRPFGASALKEHANEFFDLPFDDDFMLYTAKVKTDTLPAITHVDNTCRVQTVKDSNPIFRSLLEEFHRLTNCPILLNTSLNIAGQPISGNPDQARQLFNESELDAMFIGNEHLIK